MIFKDEKLTFNDVTIIPAKTSSIEHRNQCSPYYKINDDKEILPIFAAPMGAVINEKNYHCFIDNNITPIIPRTVKWETRIELLKNGIFVALSLDEAAALFLNSNDYFLDNNNLPYKICVDVANGHMQHMIDALSVMKDKWQDKLIIMAGNIANPKTYETYCIHNIDYVRVGIGGGSRCTTSCLTAVHYPMASLIDDICNTKADRLFKNKFCTKIVADGGIKNYADAIKALALGADYVMIGKMFAECAEAAEPIFQYVHNSAFPQEVPESSISYYVNKDYVPGTWKRKYYGMSTHYAQRLINDAAMKPNPNYQYKGEEGTVEELEVLRTLSQWNEGFINALRSAMSYSNCKTLEKFCSGCVSLAKISTSSFAYFAKKL